MAGAGDRGVEQPELDDAAVEILPSKDFGSRDGGGLGVVTERVLEDGVQFDGLGFCEGFIQAVDHPLIF